MADLECKILIAAVSELCLTGSGILTIQPSMTDEKMMLFYSGGEKREAGIGFMVNSRWAVGSVTAFQPTLDHLAVLTVAGTVKTHILPTYALTKTRLDTAKDDFYNQLQQTLDTILQTDHSSRFQCPHWSRQDWMGRNVEQIWTWQDQ